MNKYRARAEGMSAAIIDLRGTRFGQLSVPADARPIVRNGQAHWPAICDCGIRKRIRQDNLRSGRVVSCGCRRANSEVRKAARKCRGLDNLHLNNVLPEHVFGGDMGGRKSAFLAAYVRTAGSFSRAVQIAAIHRSTHYVWLKKDPKYRVAFEEAQRYAADVLQDECLRRGFEGVSKPVYYQGKIVGYDVEYSDAILLQLLRRAKPKEYGWDRKESGGAGGEVVQGRDPTLAHMSDDELRQEMERLRREIAEAEAPNQH